MNWSISVYFVLDTVHQWCSTLRLCCYLPGDLIELLRFRGSVEPHSIPMKQLHQCGSVCRTSQVTGSRVSPFWILLELRMMELVVQVELHVVQSSSQIVATNKPTPSFSHTLWTCSLRAHLGSYNLSLTTQCSWLPWQRAAKPLDPWYQLIKHWNTNVFGVEFQETTI